MSTPAYAELVIAVRREGAAIIAAAGQGLDEPVPTCGDWRVRDLLSHLTAVYRRATTAVAERATSEVPWVPPSGDAADPVEELADALDDLVHALGEADADTQVWNWSGNDQHAAFWARRMAHESAVHRYDVQRAHGVAQPIDAELAHDGIDELVDVIVPRVVARDAPSLPVGTVAFTATDDGTWTVRLDGAAAARVDAVKEPDVSVRGTASALLLAAYGRVPWTSLEVTGDHTLLDEWSRALAF